MPPMVCPASQSLATAKHFLQRFRLVSTAFESRCVRVGSRGTGTVHATDSRCPIIRIYSEPCNSNSVWDSIDALVEVHAAAATLVASPSFSEELPASVAIRFACHSDRDWKSLGFPAAEVQLRFTLPTGQSFRWRPTGPDEFTGVIGHRVFKLRQTADDIVYTVLARGEGAQPAGDSDALRDYFNLDTHLAPLAASWAAADERFRDVAPYIPGARVLRQDPLECAFEFICSSNNHISRIHGMVERLCRDFGTPLHATGSAEGADATAPSLAFFAFPTLEQLSATTEAHLRAEGFGYRAKFITGSVAALRAKPGGGAAWLQGLRDAPYREASEALCTLPGIGPKVAACVCLFALDKHAAIPVDTHVWQLACRHYTPHLRNKTLNKQVMEAVETAFVERFGPYAGWAHNTLFIAELASQQEHLPEHLRSGSGRKAAAKPKAAAKKTAAAKPAAEEAADVAAVAGDVLPTEVEGPPAPVTPGKPALRAAAKRKAAAVKVETEVKTEVEMAVRLDPPTADGSAAADETSSRRRRRIAVSTAKAAEAAADAALAAPATSPAAEETGVAAGPLTPAKADRPKPGGAGGRRRGDRMGDERALEHSLLAGDAGCAADVAENGVGEEDPALNRKRIRAQRR